MDIIIETPKGSQEKYKYDEGRHLFRFYKVLPAGLSFPFDFGFVPGTKGEDGDPIDVMVLSEFRGFPGCLVDCRIVGCIRVEQSRNKRWISNDRFLAIPEQSAVFRNVLSLKDLPPSIIDEIENFFVTSMDKEGKEFRLPGRLEAEEAIALLAQ